MVWFTSPSPMNNEVLDRLIKTMGTAVEGQLGFWQFEFSDVRLICITDESHDRMRVMTPIASVSDITTEDISHCMSANFDRALDARYCINEETLWGAFIHPLGCMTEPLFESACRQVSEIAKNFGGTFSSGELMFNPDVSG